MLTVIAEIICHSEQDMKTVLDSFNNIRAQVLQEPGCHLYDVYNHNHQWICRVF